jgi:predicted transcriptional regulator
MAAVKNVLWWLLANSLGGLNRGRILHELLTTPHNANELSKILSLDYKTTRYHLQVLEENGLITSAGSGYGKTYFPSQSLEENLVYFREIWDKIGKKTD